jgi:uncharacterized membrane protein YccC
MELRKQDVGRATQVSAGEVAAFGLLLATSCVFSNWLITHILAGAYSLSGEDDLLGGMWAVVATIFVFRYSQADSVHSALSRMTSTLVSFVLCLAYLLLFPSHIWGMAALIGIGTVAVTLMGRADDTITTGITIAVVIIVAELSPRNARLQPILRLVDTAVGVVAAWISSKVISNTSVSPRHAG